MPDDQGGESSTGSQVGSWAWAWANRNAIFDTLKQIYQWFRGSSTAEQPQPDAPGILILGAGGTGKTTLGRLLAGDHDYLLDPPAPYEGSVNVEKFRFEDDQQVEVVVPPGQPHRRDATWHNLKAAIGAGRVRGIILLAAYGYHSFGELSYQGHHLFEKAKGRAGFVKDYLEDRLKEELNILNQLAPQVEMCGNKMWILTVVTKQDLWYKARARVERHYRKGEYGAIIDRVIGNRGPERLRHEFAFSSLVISNYRTGKGELLRANQEGYDHELHVKSLRRLFETIDALRRWEAGP